MARFYIRTGAPATAPPATNRLSWFKADALGLSNGASVATWADQDGNSNLTKIGGATVTYSTTAGPNSVPAVVFNETGGLNGTLGADSGSVLAAFYVIYNNFPSGPQVIKQDGGGALGNFWCTEPAIGNWQMGGTTGSVAGGDTSTSAWRIIMFLWNTAGTSAIYQSGGAAAASNATITSGTNGTAMNVGGAAGAGSWNGNIAEVIWYTTTDLPTLNGAGAYLGWKYKLNWVAAS